MLKIIAGVFFGLFVSVAYAQMAVRVPTNGKLIGYVVQDADGREVCRDPSVWNNFRGPDSFIVCE